LRDHLRSARAFVFAAEEDFGIAPLEAQACGTPVIAYGRGGVLETISGLESSQPTGVFYDQQSVESLIHGVENFERNASRISPDACRQNTLRFSPERFREELGGHIRKRWNGFQSGRRGEPAAD
jgi:glycosyltransferase involved in cell wall biosynthesis